MYAHLTINVKQEMTLLQPDFANESHLKFECQKKTKNSLAIAT